MKLTFYPSNPTFIMSLLKLAKIINTKESASRYFQKERWKRAFGCIRCGSIRAYKHRKLKNGLQKYRCEDCRHVFSDQSTTLLRWNKMDIRSVASIVHLHKRVHKLCIRDIAEEVEVNKNSVHRLTKRLRQMKSMFYHALSPKQLRGTIEMDETRIAKGWYWGAIERTTGRAIVEYVCDRSETMLSSKIWKYIHPGESTVITDEWRGYILHPRWFTHYTVNHSKSFVHPECNAIHTNTIEGLWKQLKRTIHHFCNGIASYNIQDSINAYFYSKFHEQFQKPSFFPLYCEP